MINLEENGVEIKKSQKNYFKLVVTDDDYYFENRYGNILRFAGGGNGRSKFIIQALQDLYGDKEGAEIFSKFLAGVENIKNISDFGADAGVFVLYKKKYVADL